MSQDNYLKHYRPTLYYFRDNYELKTSDIEFLFFVYDMESFTCMDIMVEYRSSNSFITRNIPELLNKGYIKIYLERAHNRARRYMISQRGKLLVTRFYGILKEKENGLFK